jgi:hypothetical protein
MKQRCAARSPMPPTFRIREVAARNHIDPRTLEKAIASGPEAVKPGLARDRTISALAELGFGADEVPRGAA